MSDIPPTSEPIQPLDGVEFVLEGLHLSKRLNNEAVSSAAVYRGRS